MGTVLPIHTEEGRPIELLGGAGEINEGKLAEEVILTNLSTRIRLAFSATCFLCNKSFRHIADALS